MPQKRTPVVEDLSEKLEPLLRSPNVKNLKTIKKLQEQLQKKKITIIINKMRRKNKTEGNVIMGLPPIIPIDSVRSKDVPILILEFNPANSVQTYEIEALGQQLELHQFNVQIIPGEGKAKVFDKQCLVESKEELFKKFLTEYPIDKLWHHRALKGE